MIIKIKTKNKGWYIVDNVTNLSTEGTPVYITGEDHLNHIMAVHDGVNIVWVFSKATKSLSKDSPMPVCSIGYTLNDQRNLVLFDTIAYITNDQNKTIERVVADEQYLP